MWEPYPEGAACASMKLTLKTLRTWRGWMLKPLFFSFEVGLWRGQRWPDVIVALTCTTGKERKPFTVQKYATLPRAGNSILNPHGNNNASSARVTNHSNYCREFTVKATKNPFVFVIV